MYGQVTLDDYKWAAAGRVITSTVSRVRATVPLAVCVLVRCVGGAAVRMTCS